MLCVAVKCDDTLIFPTIALEVADGLGNKCRSPESIPMNRLLVRGSSQNP